MNASDEDRLLEIVRGYQAALEAGERTDRAALLAAHPDLASELAGFLDALEALHGAASLCRVTPVLHAEMALGDFRIVREIGRGGMGIVYEAEQLSLGRNVALKVLPLAGAMDERQLARFKNEARAAAQLHHSHIVPVYAVGSERGVHFYAMQLIEGRTLAEVVAQMRERRDTPVRSSVETIRAEDTLNNDSLSAPGEAHHRHAARLMLQAAQALDHAHQQGVIHRDIKPANLLLDRRAQLWVTDFGLAQFSAGLDLTRTGDVLGTLRYASPEQASGQGILDHRADVYSLGATFYELLTLSPPFAGTSRGVLLRQILDDEPRPLRLVDRALPVELETIVLKCLSKLPSERYATARELADDLERFLTNRPIRAKRPTMIDRGRKWLRRHPGVAGVTALSLVACTVGLIINQALLSREQARTREALRGQQSRAEQAERRLQQTRHLVDFLIELGEEELAQRPSAMLGLRRRMLETGLAHYQALIADSGDETNSAELETARARIERLLADLASLEGADLAMLLGSDNVLDELDPEDDQRTQLRDFARKLGKARFEMMADREIPPARKRQLEVEMARTSEQALAKLLDAPQRKRLDQIALQFKGMSAFREPEVVARLALTAEQRKRLREIENELFLPPPPPPDHGPTGPPRKGGFKGWPGFDFEARARELMERCLRVLNDEQRTKWNALIGERFTMPPWFGGPHRPPPGPPPR